MLAESRYQRGLRSSYGRTDRTKDSGAIVLCLCEVPRPGNGKIVIDRQRGHADADRFETVASRNVAIEARPVDRNPPDNPRLVGATLWW